MIISHYGKKFLNKYNAVENKNLTPKEFFVNIFYPIFYGHEKTLMFIQNSPFSNPANRKKSIDEKLELFFDKIKNKEYDSSMFVGGYAVGGCSTTSYNVPTQYRNIIDEDEIYLSWIGQGLSIQFKGINFLLDNDDILYSIYLGWKKYRELLSNPIYEKYKSGQISTWNSLWLSDFYSTKGRSPKFNPFEQNKDALSSPSWVRTLFNISSKHPNNINAYAYKFSQTNETYGNVLIELNKIDGFINFCEAYFGSKDFLTKPELFEAIWGTAYSVERICELGSMGIIALKPELLRLEDGKYRNAYNEKRIKKHYEELTKNENTYKLYKLYLMATLNMKDIENEINTIAKKLVEFKIIVRRNNGDKLAKELIAATNMSTFLKVLSSAMEVCVAENLVDHKENFEALYKLGTSDETKLSNVIMLLKFAYHKFEIEKNNNL